MDLTDQQYAAINCRETSVALSAGAGCGKTSVLTQRFISHLDRQNGNKSEATRLQQLIAITFTDAAAREMRSRIRQACYEKLQDAPTAEAQQHWLRHLREIDAARISTIHAFCASLLRTHAAQAGLDPTFGVLDQTDADVLQYDVIDDVLRELLTGLDPDVLDLSTACGLARLKTQVATLLGRRHDASFHRWLSATAHQVTAAWHDWYTREAFPNALCEIADETPIHEIRDLLEAIEPKKESFATARNELLELLPKLSAGKLTAHGLDRICDNARIKSKAGPYICTAKDWPDKDSYNSYSKLCEELRNSIGRHQPAKWDDAAAEETAGLGLALLKLTAKVASAYDEQKRAQGKLDFDDLLAKAFALVNDSENIDLTNRLADELRLLLVDEFQDTDQLQADLVTKLCGPGFDTGRLFFVGDFKQSIYRFRGAEPSVFHELRQKIIEQGRLPLTVNFRSQPEILHFVNALFCETFRGEHEEYEKLRPKREQQTESPAVEFLWTMTPDKNKRSSTGAAQKAREQEAKSIACRLRDLLDDANTHPVVDKKTREPRQLQPGDVAILFRTLSDVQVYEEALRLYDLDYYLVGGYAFYAQQEIFDVLNLLRAVASSADDMSLAGALRSPFFSLADETLFWLADSAETLNAGLMADSPPPQLSPEEHAKVLAAAATLQRLRNIKDRVPIATLLNTALGRTGYDAVLLAEFLGERKLANLHKLIERARLTDHNGVTDLDGFITQLSQFIAREPEESLAATLPEAANVIRLMTIHHAKGLEFPLVIVPDLDRQPLLRTPPAALHATLGPLVPSPADDDSEKTATGMSLYAALERREELEERKRLLYVACTRAADYLILSSSLEEFDKPKSDWMKLLAERFDLQTGKLIADLPEGYETSTARVTIDPKSNYKTAGRSRGPDLIKLLDEAHELAANGEGIIPPETNAIPIDRTARNEFSFSRLTGQLTRHQGWHALTLGEGRGASPGNSTPFVGDSGRATPNSIDIDPRGLGTLIHDILARIDFADPADIADWCEHLAPLHVVHNAKETASSARDMIQRFTISPRGRQLATADALHREIDFVLPWPPDQKNSDHHYIQGVIDCLYQDTEGGWHILDFKTNDISSTAIGREAKKYELQLSVYAIAAERALGESPTELSLHFLRPGQEHSFTWNDTARQRAISLVNEAIATARIAVIVESGFSDR